MPLIEPTRPGPDPGSDPVSTDSGATGSRPPVVVVHLEGDLDEARAATLRADLSRTVGTRAVLLDQTDVDFIDPVGLAVLLGAIRRIHERGGLVAIVAADPRRGIARGLRTSGVDRLVDLTETPAEGFRQLGCLDPSLLQAGAQIASELS